MLKPRVLRGALIGTLVLLVLAGSAAWAWASNPSIAPIAPPLPTSFPQAQVNAGAVLAAAGNCAACHTSPYGLPYGGGNGFETGFGLVYSTNISPDPETGIGRWSQAAFARAMREGVARDGTHLLPAFPYTHFTKLNAGDIQALYAFFMTRPPVVVPERRNTIHFPLNVRGLQAGWKLLFFKRGEYQPNTAKSDPWNRGAYLSEGIAHCAACHTPRNRFGAERTSASYAGERFDGWLAPPLNATNPAPSPWTQRDLHDYLRTGESLLHGAAAGAMAGVVKDGLAPLSDSDVQAIALYFADINDSADRAQGAAAALNLAMSRRLVDSGRETEPGANLYLSACAACHYDPPQNARAVQASLALSTSLTSEDPSNFIQTVLRGVGGAGTAGPFMPGYALALTNSDIELLASYLRRTRTGLPEWHDLPAAIAAIRPAERPSR